MSRPRRRARHRDELPECLECRRGVPWGVNRCDDCSGWRDSCRCGHPRGAHFTVSGPPRLAPPCTALGCTCPRFHLHPSNAETKEALVEGLRRSWGSRRA
jgi:hypothetical protein